MPLPSPHGDTECAQFLQALPPDGEAMRREHGALPSAGTIPTPEALLRAILLYCGPAQSWREVAGTLTLRAERITAQAVWQRLQRWTPLLPALVQQRVPLAALPAWPEPRRFRACDGTPLAGAGATGTDDRLHLVMHVRPLRLQEGQSRATKQGEGLKNSRLPAGAVLGAERGSGSYAGLLDSGCARGAAGLVRWHPPLPWEEPREKSRPRDGCAALHSPKPGTLGSLPVIWP